MPDSFVDTSCRVFSEQLASPAPVPGGGGAAALIGSLAASLGSMAASLTMGKKKFLTYENDHRRMIDETQSLRIRFLALIDADAAAFEPLSRVYSMDKNTPEYAKLLRTATLAACKAPFEMMQCCSTLITLLEELREKCSVLLLSDVGCAAVASRAALEAASMNVFVNTRMLPDDSEAAAIATEADAILQRDIPRAQALAASVSIYLRAKK